MIKKQAIVFLPVLVVLVTLGLAGCGGGGGSKPTPVYQASAIGVIMQSQSDETGVGSSWLSKNAMVATANALQKVKNLNVIGFQGATPAILKSGISQSLLEESVAYIYVKWDRIPNATKYKILYNEVEVWDSTTVKSENDGAFSLSNPEAYLDLDEELSMITEAGKYQFQIVALNGSTDIHQFSAVEASLGMVLATYPTGVQYNSGTQTLTWTGLTGASGYRVTVYNDLTYKEVKYSSGTTLINATSYSLAGKNLTAGTYYPVIVDAVAVDQTGRTVEITRGISGFYF